MDLQALIVEILEKDIPIVGVRLRDGKLTYQVDGFTKSGYAEVYETEDGIECRTRYGETDKIESFEDLATVAFNWHIWYANKTYGYGWACYWLPIFEKYGWVKVHKVEKVETNIEIV